MSNKNIDQKLEFMHTIVTAMDRMDLEPTETLSKRYDDKLISVYNKFIAPLETNPSPVDNVSEDESKIVEDDLIEKFGIVIADVMYDVDADFHTCVSRCTELATTHTKEKLDKIIEWIDGQIKFSSISIVSEAMRLVKEKIKSLM